MLVLSRHCHEEKNGTNSVHIINSATEEVLVVKILSFDRGNVRLGIDAPRSYAVVREELLNRKKKRNKS